MTKESARRSSCGPGISGSFSSSSGGDTTANRDLDDLAGCQRELVRRCEMRFGNQEDASSVVADAKTAMSEATLKSAANESNGNGGCEADDGDAPEWLGSNVLRLEDGEQQLQHLQQQTDQLTALEALLDLELDVYNLPALEDNQFVIQEQGDDFGALSLELLALQSPHGKRQQWDTDESAATQAHYEKLCLPEEPPPHHTKLRITHSKASTGILDLTSPSQHVAPFQPSPCHSADGDEYDLASPVGLPDTPNAASQTSVVRWESAPDLRYEVDEFFESVPPPPPIRTPSRSVAKKTQRNPFARASRISPTGRLSSATARPAASVAAASTPYHQTLMQQQQPVSVPKQKVKHGGIYSLLLKNRSAGDHEPVLVDDEKRSPEVPEDSPGRARSAKKSPPPTFGKQHGGIYRMLRSSKRTPTTVAAFGAQQL